MGEVIVAMALQGKVRDISFFCCCQGNSHKVTLVHYIGWPANERPHTTGDIKEILGLPQLSTENSPIVVVCR